MTSPKHIEEIAARFLAREDRGIDTEERERWLAQSTAHRIAYLRLKEAWQQADRLVVLKSPAISTPSIASWRLVGALQLIAAGLIVAVMCGAAVSFSYLQKDRKHELQIAQTANYITGIGQQKTINLADGSKIELDTDTRLQAAETNGGRAVILNRGQAYFDIIHNANHPFVVTANDRRIVDLGTKFSVRLSGDQIKVVVKEGRVRIERIDGSGNALIASGGEMMIAKSGAALIVSKTSREINNELDWQHGVLVFNQETLADVAAEFNRYNAKQIIVEGAARDIRIGGSFQSTNIDVFSHLVEQGFDVTVRNSGDEVVISK
jgi:transmembrane sensor